MSFVKHRRFVAGTVAAGSLVLASSGLGATLAAAAAAAQGKSGSPPGHSSPPSGSADLSLAGTTSPDQARGKFNLPGSHRPFFAHGGKSQPPSPPASSSAVSVAGLTVPGPNGSGAGISASSTDQLDSLNTQVADLGSDQSLEPPDNGLGTGNGYVVELLNDSGWIWQSSGGSLSTPYPGNPFDLNKFFYVPSGYSASDPRIVYDPVGQVWIASAVAFSSSGSSYLDIDVSSTSNPEGGWIQYDLQDTTDLFDQPKLGLSGSQIVVSANDFLAGELFQGAVTWVFDRVGLESGSFLGATTFGPDSNEFSIVPTLVTTGPVEYAVWNDADCSYSGCSTGSPTLGVIEFSGSPKTSVSATIYNPTIAATSSPPTATQPSPGKGLNTDDDRYLQAIWLPGGTIWTAGNDACTPPGDTVVRPCMRFDQISVSGTPSVLQDFDAGAKGAALMYPAVAVDSSGNLGVVYSASSSTEPASVGTAGQAKGAPLDSLSTGPWLQTGSGAYVDGTSEPRWGDYSGASAMGTGIWVAGEYSGLSGTADWAVAGAFLTFGGGGGGSTPNVVGVSAKPSQLTAGSGAQSSVTATVTNNGTAVSGDTVNFSASGTCGPMSPSSGVTTSTGTATITYTAASSPGTCTVTATDTTGQSGSAGIAQVSNKIAVKANPTQLVAGSGTKSSITATVTANGAPVSSDSVAFKTKGTCGPLSTGAASTNTSGVATVTYTASTSTGTCTVTASDTSGGTASVSVSQVRRHK